jgi:hypothetical protein
VKQKVGEMNFVFGGIDVVKQPMVKLLIMLHPAIFIEQIKLSI